MARPFLLETRPTDEAIAAGDPPDLVEGAKPHQLAAPAAT